MLRRISALLLALCLLACSGALAETTYPMDTDVELKIFSTIFWDNTTLGYTDCNQRPITQYINEATGVNAIWDTYPAGADQNQVFNTMVASGTILDYDIFCGGGINGTNASQLLADGIALPLNDYMDQVPNYTRYFESVPTLEKKSRTNDGVYYGFYGMRESGWANTYIGPLVRQDWLDALNLEMPRTIADWETVLRAFKEHYGATFTSTLSRMNIYGLAGAFNAYTTFALTRYLNDEGKVQIGASQPEWKTYMETLHAWYEEGLIDPDLITNDDNAVRTKALNEQTGLIIFNLGSVDVLNSQAQEAGLSAQWVGCPYPVNAEGVVPWMQGNPNVAAENYVAWLTGGCDETKLPVALAWINWAYSEDGFNTTNYGKEGETFDLVDGKPVLRDSILKSDEGVSNALMRITSTVGSYWPIQAEGLVRAKNSEAACAAVDTWLENNDIEKHILPNISLTDAETTEVADLATALSTYVSEQSLKFFTGERSLDEFDAYVGELEKIGLPKFLEIYQGAVDRYNAD